MTTGTPLRVFIGYDSKEPIAFAVLAHSIISRVTCPVTITPIARQGLGGWYWRERGPTESTEFSLTRFLVPALSEFRGYSLFLDCDMLCRVDLGLVMQEVNRQPDKAVWVCKHDYAPRSGAKFLGQTQTAYPRKNWSSFVLWNNARCARLTPSYVNRASGLDLHRFTWLGSEEEDIGGLPLEWNWLVGEYPPNPNAKILHFTRGGPWFDETKDCDHAADWVTERQAMDHAAMSVMLP